MLFQEIIYQVIIPKYAVNTSLRNTPVELYKQHSSTYNI